MKYFPNQRVRIRHDCNAVGPYRLKGEGGFYELDVTFEGAAVIAGEHAIEPVFDKPEKISWQHSACVWSPFSQPAVIRRRVRA